MSWAISYEREQQFRDAFLGKLEELKAPCGMFHRYKEDNPDAADEDVWKFELKHWQEISMEMGVPLKTETE